jgi:hypothetical protein
VVVAFFFLPFVVLLLVLLVLVDFVVIFSWANTAIPLSSERPSIRLIIFFIVLLVLLGEVLVEINYTSTIIAGAHEECLKRLLKSLHLVVALLAFE